MQCAMTRTPENDAERNARKRSVPNAGRDRYVKPEPEFEIRIAEGREAEMLAEFQARVLWEVTKWQLGQTNLQNGLEVDE